jgi:hypothetical protein
LGFEEQAFDEKKGGAIRCIRAIRVLFDLLVGVQERLEGIKEPKHET